MVIINGVLLSVATVVVALRFYSRIRITHFVGADDWWMLAAWVSLTFDKQMTGTKLTLSRIAGWRCSGWGLECLSVDLEIPQVLLLTI
jgi:hypothetical protein